MQFKSVVNLVKSKDVKVKLKNSQFVQIENLVKLQVHKFPNSFTLNSHAKTWEKNRRQKKRNLETDLNPKQS